MADKGTTLDIETSSPLVKALEIAELMTRFNEYDGKIGQPYQELRAADIRRLVNILLTGKPEEVESKAVAVDTSSIS